MVPQREFYSVSEVADVLKICKDRVYEWLRTERLRGTRVTKHSAWRVHRSELQRLAPGFGSPEATACLLLEATNTGGTVQIAVDPDMFAAAEDVCAETGRTGLGINLEGWATMPKNSKVIVTVPLTYWREQRTQYERDLETSGLLSLPFVPRDIADELTAVSYLLDLKDQEERRCQEPEVPSIVDEAIEATRQLIREHKHQKHGGIES